MQNTARPQTIQVFLPSGDARGIRVAEVTTRIVQAIEVPRNMLSDFFSMSESKQVAVYFLFGVSDADEPMVYIGQTGDLKARLEAHNKEKEFWQRAVVIISRTQSLTNTHTLYLEWKAIQKAEAAGRYKKTNSTRGGRPYITAPLEADCLEIFDTTRIILGTLGYPVFEPLLNKQQKNDENERFYCTRSGIHAVGEYTNEGFVVLKGSIGNSVVNASADTPAYHQNKEQLMQTNKITIKDTHMVFNEDVLFSTPSGASSFVIGSSSNGWIDWKRKDGQTLNAVKRDAQAL